MDMLQKTAQEINKYTIEPIFTFQRYIFEKYFLIIKTLPFVAVILFLHYLTYRYNLQLIQYLPLFGNLIATNIFLFGFILSENIKEFRAGEKAPGRIVASLEPFIDIAQKLKDEQNPQGDIVKKSTVELSRHIRAWLYKKISTEHIYDELRSYISQFKVLNDEKHISDRTFELLLRERNTLRSLIIEIDMMRKTAFVSSGYVIAELFSVLIISILIFTNIEPFFESMIIIGLVSFVFTYILLLIKDLDNPFTYSEKDKLTSRVNLVQLKKFEKRYEGE